MPKFLTLAAAALAGACLIGFYPAAGVKASPNLWGQFAQAQSEAYSEAELETYVAAVLKIYEIDKAWQPRIDEAQTNGEAAALTREATEQMIGEVQALGLSVEEYNAITEAAEQDNQLYERIRGMLAERR